MFADAHVYMEHASRGELELDDIRLAIQGRVNYAYSEPPTVETLLEMANSKNSMGLLLPERPAVLLPPEKFCLANVNYQIDSKRKREQVMVDDARAKSRQQQHHLMMQQQQQQQRRRLENQVAVKATQARVQHVNDGGDGDDDDADDDEDME